MKPYYEKDGITIYHGDCREILPTLPKVDLVLTDPPYGIQRHGGMGSKGFDGFGNGVRRKASRYHGKWDNERPPAETFRATIASAGQHIIWGGNYFSDFLPVSGKWLVWDKEQTMPSYSDAELAWTTLGGSSVKMFRYCGSGLLAKEKDRVHPTQKPLALMSWCLRLSKDSVSILDPFMGSGTTLVAARNLGRRAIGIEIEEKYCEIAAKRLQQQLLPMEAGT